jgi:aspartate/methionine/tyrosine aminotransferase
MKTARRLDIIEEYYFSSKLRSTTIGFRGKPIINMELKPRLAAITTVIDAVKLALEDENAHHQSYQGLPELRKKYG